MARAGEKPRRRWRIVLIVLLAIIVLVVGAELLLRAILPGIAADRARGALGLPDDQEVEVQAEGILLPQIIGGSISEVTLRSEDVALGGLRGDVEVIATGVPISGGAFGAISGTVRIDPDDIVPLLTASPLPVERVLTDTPNAVLMGDVDVFGADVSLTLSVLPSVADGDLLLEPVAVSVGGLELDLESAAAMIGEGGEALNAPTPICIADRIPAGIMLTDIVVEEESILVSFTADGAIAADSALRSPGTCD